MSAAFCSGGGGRMLLPRSTASSCAVGVNRCWAARGGALGGKEWHDPASRHPSSGAGWFSSRSAGGSDGKGSGKASRRTKASASGSPPVEEGAIAATLVETELHVEANKSYLAYALSVIVGRALPDARDGLKPVVSATFDRSIAR